MRGGSWRWREPRRIVVNPREPSRTVADGGNRFRGDARRRIDAAWPREGTHEEFASDAHAGAARDAAPLAGCARVCAAA